MAVGNLPSLNGRGVALPWAGRRFRLAGDGGLGWLPVLSLVSALGLLILAAANNAARLEMPGAIGLFWIGLVVLFTPTAARMLSEDAGRTERIALAGMLGVLLYVAKILHSPLAFTFHDEFIHWSSAQDILRTGHLFHENPLITVSPLFPGLQVATTALMHLTGLDIYGAGAIVLGVARLVLVLSLFLLAEQITGSPRAAGFAALIYMGNPNFLFFTAQYAYESLALPFALLTLYLATRRSAAAGATRAGLSVAALLSLGATAVSHHLTSYALAAFLLLWTVMPQVSLGLEWLRRQFVGRSFKRAWMRVLIADAEPADEAILKPGGLALVAVVVALSWLTYVAWLVVGYLAPVLSSALLELIRLILGELPQRELFRDYAGNRPPLWEQLTGFGSVLCILAALPYGLLAIWRNYRTNPLALTMGVAALAYPAALLMRLTQAGMETANRSSEFLFVPIACVLGLSVNALLRAGIAAWWPRFVRPILIVWATIIFIGGTIVGSSPWSRLPAGYLVSADTRSIEPEGIGAALWARQALGPGQRVAADRINRLLMAAYGEQRVVTNLQDGVNVAYVYMAPHVYDTERRILREADVTYLLVDRRLSSGLPLSGVYFENSEPDSNRHKQPLDAQVLAKFDTLPDTSRIFDSGNIQVYDVRRVR
jgi:hypothetical protein